MFKLKKKTLEDSCITGEERVYAAVIKMFSINIFRPLPAYSAFLPANPYETPDSADEADTLEPAWPHLEV